MNKVSVNISPKRKVNATALNKRSIQATIYGITLDVVKNYNALENKPSINGVTLEGNMILSDFDIQNIANLSYEEVIET